ncbi:MAG TPA: ATPase, partial [Pseudorhodoferax sp.]|nr:ATPase [Pseudorhodoferax sp.]
DASAGIPRRINNLCDRLLLLGFLAEKHSFTVDDANAVIHEIHEESGGPALQGAAAAPRTGTERFDPGLYTEHSLAFDPAVVEGLAGQATHLEDEQYGDRLQRLERSMLRLERINLELLSMLKKLLGAVKRPVEDPAP